MTKEWESRVSMWINALKKRLYQPVGSMEFSYCTTYEHWPYETAMEAAYLPIQEGDFWGEEWEYGWFQSRFRLGEWAKGKRIVMDLNLGGEATLFVNGSVWGTRRADWVHEPHHYLCDNYLVKENQGDEEIYLVAECYAGHDLPPEAGEATAGPVGYAYQWNRPQKANRAQLGKCTYGIWNEDVYHLYLEVQVLHDIYKEADPNSLRVADLEEALQEFTMLVDFSLEEEDFLNCIKECRRFLKPYLSCVNGSTVPRMHAVGHAHIDLAWFWPMQETERKCARTMAAQIRHMEEYPEYKMLLSQPALYEMIKKHYPSLFTQLKEKAAEGQLIPEGGMWVESDTNIPSGESLIRQFLYGKKYFREEFGVESELLWLPDVFGYSAALPQIMNGCGIKYFATAKIFWTYNGGEPFPYYYFNWKGIDGSTTPSFIHVEYSSKTDAASLIKKWRGRRQREGLKRMLVATGYGDGGGGATRDHIENVRLLENCEGVPSITFDHPGNCFVQLDKECQHVPEYVGELYFQAHRGTYTSQAQIKKLNRFCELAMREAEIWNSLAYTTTVFTYPREDFEQNWKNILINQFHDILPGSAIHKVYERAGHELEAVLAFSRMRTDEALNALIQEKEGQKALTIFNSLSWDRNVPVILSADWNGAMTRDGKRLEGQQLENGICIEVPVPSIGTTTIYPAPMVETNAAVSVDDKVMENEWLRLVLNGNGEIARMSAEEHVIGHEVIQALVRLAYSLKEETALLLKRKIKTWITSDAYRDFLEHAFIPVIGLARVILQDPMISAFEFPAFCGTYPAMDRVMHRRKDFAVGISMSSERTGKYESIHNENVRGWYTADGMVYLYNSDLGQYSDGYFPTINAYRMPGTTVDTIERAEEGVGFGKEPKLHNAWVGGASLKDLYGVAGMDLEAECSDLRAKKSWFLFDKEIVCLGAGITCTGGREIETIVENRKVPADKSGLVTINGDLLLQDASGKLMRNDVRSIHLTGHSLGSDIGYYFPENCDLEILKEERTSSWRSINQNSGSDEEVTNSFVNIVIHHGKDPENDVYEYVLLPGMSCDEVQCYSTAPSAEVIQNTATIQAVKQKELNILAANFWKDKSCKVEGITCNKKASVILQEKDDCISMAVSDPTWKNEQGIQIELDYSAVGVKSCDEGIRVIQLHPTVIVLVDTKNAMGKSFQVCLKI